MNDKKFCPMKAMGPNQYAPNAFCEGYNCAWWCEWNQSCAIAAIPGVIYDKEATHGKD